MIRGRIFKKFGSPDFSRLLTRTPDMYLEAVSRTQGLRTRSLILLRIPSIYRANRTTIPADGGSNKKPRVLVKFAISLDFLEIYGAERNCVENTTRPAMHHPLRPS